jgi:hypothetical protein
VSQSDDPKAARHRRQIGTVLASSFVLAFTCCGGGIALRLSSRSREFAAVLTMIGFLAFLTFVFTAIVALLKMVFGRL